MSLLQPQLPDRLKSMSDEDVHALIAASKAKLGDRCVILGHHYQRDEVIRHADHTGDSLKLARIARELERTPYIVFCGVHFMAETADILTSPAQEVSLPDLQAGCDMADMAETWDVEAAWDEAMAALATKERDAGKENRIVPVTYINSKASLKAFVGNHGGTICTSGNARAVIEWALARGEHLFFFPDQHLGRNICKAMGFDPETDMILWDPKKPLGGHTTEKIRAARIWLWQGHCPVHALFTLHQIKKIRAESPETRIIVHPECAMEVVDAADLSGSTEQIIRAIESSPEGSRWAVGTEKHLVERLAASHPDKVITSLNPYTCLCGTMNRISARHLAWVLDDLVQGRPMRNRITVDEKTAAASRVALDRMFTLN
ncbi:quinolinate synthase NadA [bacterium]|nr:quinolinate synthase NadA [bacterium]